jgi:hypothetical protein
LNGNLINASLNTYTRWTPFSVGEPFTQDTDSFFKYGLNTLSFVVDNTGGGATGVRVEFANSAMAKVVPIPAAVWLFGSGVIGIAGLSKRKKAI